MNNFTVKIFFWLNYFINFISFIIFISTYIILTILITHIINIIRFFFILFPKLSFNGILNSFIFNIIQKYFLVFLYFFFFYLYCFHHYHGFFTRIIFLFLFIILVFEIVPPNLSLFNSLINNLTSSFMF